MERLAPVNLATLEDLLRAAETAAEAHPELAAELAGPAAAVRAQVDAAENRIVVPLTEMSAALDEIYALRSALAYEATAAAVNLEYKTFPKSRRRFAEAAVNRMRAAARGDWRSSHLEMSSAARKYALREAGADELLTRPTWLAEDGNRHLARTDADATGRRGSRTA